MTQILYARQCHTLLPQISQSSHEAISQKLSLGEHITSDVLRKRARRLRVGAELIGGLKTELANLCHKLTVSQLPRR